MRTARSLLLLAAVPLAALAPSFAGAQTGVAPEVKKAMRDAANPVVVVSTTLGDITLELYRKEAPKTTENFLAYAKKKHYDGTIFHRVIDNFMIQGGGFDKDLKEKSTNPPIVNEAANGLSNELGTVAMARTSEPNSATSQFYINVKGNKFLDKGVRDPAGYCVFGKVVGGMDVVNQIKAVKTTQKPPAFEALPLVPVVIKSTRILQS